MHSRAISSCFGTHPSSDADTMLPSGIAATAVTCHLWPCSLRIGCAVAAFHTMIDLSLEPAVLKADSSADHAAMLIANLWEMGTSTWGSLRGTCQECAIWIRCRGLRRNAGYCHNVVLVSHLHAVDTIKLVMWTACQQNFMHHQYMPVMHNNVYQRHGILERMRAAFHPDLAGAITRRCRET